MSSLCKRNNGREMKREMIREMKREMIREMKRDRKGNEKGRKGILGNCKKKYGMKRKKKREM